MLEKFSILDIKRGSHLSIYLEYLRTIATLGVLLSHIKELYYVDNNQINIQTNFLVKILYFLSMFGHDSVIVFFVLSGLLVGNSVLKSLKQDKFTWKSYLIARLSRLWIVLIPALILGITWDLLGIYLSGGDSIIYAGQLRGTIFELDCTIADKINPLVFLANMFFLQNIHFPVLGSNGSLWSLSHEFWYYMAFPVILLAALNFQKRKNNKFIIYALIILIFAFGLNFKNDEGFFIWLFGSIVSIQFQPIFIYLAKYKLFFKKFAYSLCLIILGAIKLNIITYNHRYMIFGFAVAFLLTILSIEDRENSEHKQNIITKVAVWFSDFSYTLYLTHLPLFVFINSFTIKAERWQPDIQHGFYGLVILILAIIYARIVYFFTERHTPSIRLYIKSKI